MCVCVCVCVCIYTHTYTALYSCYQSFQFPLLCSSTCHGLPHLLHVLVQGQTNAHHLLKALLPGSFLLIPLYTFPFLTLCNSHPNVCPGCFLLQAGAWVTASL